MKTFLDLFSIYISTIYKVYWLDPRYSKKIVKELNQTLADQGYTLEQNTAKRINIYIVFSGLTTNWFCQLRGHKTSPKEKLLTLYLATIIPLLDDLTDDLKIKSLDIIKDLKNNTNEIHPTMPAIRYLYYKLIDNCSDRFVSTFHQALLVQDQSIMQFDANEIDAPQLKEITYKKGGISTFLFRLILDNPIIENEEKTIYELGYLLQLVNDMLDVYKDHINKQQTLFTNALSLEGCVKEFHDSLRKITKGISSLNYKHKDIKKALGQMSLITSMGKVCIEQLLKCQSSTNGTFNIDQYERKQLICDMDTLSNKLKSFKFSLNYYRQI